MKNIRNLLLIVLALAMVVSLAACGAQPAPPVESDEPEVSEAPQTVFDFGDYVVEIKNIEFVEDDYGYESLLFTMAYTHVSGNDNGRLDENIRTSAIQDGEELSKGVIQELFKNEPYFVHEGETADFYVIFHLKSCYEGEASHDYVNDLELTFELIDGGLTYTTNISPADYVPADYIK